MDDPKKSEQKNNKSEVKKQNQDFPNIPASSHKVGTGKMIKKEVRESSKLHKDGKTDNTDKESEN
ncbi:MAG: hypothetical protein K0M63_04190 [Weeksellaceae bacterium]|nr:hypothetical protein [Weeksellaceae bacterium]